ncbi:hypothetical protein ElyMa_000142600 [Elysia marginata]|uniref:Uncharacterized protein n=1 Tax=Elysia marginata TaxID=1093978 RepID=A0AAV4EPX0_9GAST|nr:hypothetical protein ElyMa_000142600 [Elysia marginata]
MTRIPYEKLRTGTRPVINVCFHMLPGKHRPAEAANITKVLDTILSGAISSNSFHVFSSDAISASVSHLQVILGPPLALI